MLNGEEEKEQTEERIYCDHVPAMFHLDWHFQLRPFLKMLWVPVVFADLPHSLIVCIHGLVGVSLCWIHAVHGFPWKTKTKNIYIIFCTVVICVLKKYIYILQTSKQAVFTFSGWGSAGVCAGATLSVSLHAASAAPAAPAPPAGPHTARRTARVWTRLAHSASAASLCGALASGTSGALTCRTSARLSGTGAEPRSEVGGGEEGAMRGCESTPTVQFEKTLCTRRRWRRFQFGAVATAVPVAGSGDAALCGFPVRLILPLWNHHTVLRSTAAAITQNWWKDVGMTFSSVVCCVTIKVNS